MPIDSAKTKLVAADDPVSVGTGASATTHKVAWPQEISSHGVGETPISFCGQLIGAYFCLCAKSAIDATERSV